MGWRYHITSRPLVLSTPAGKHDSIESRNGQATDEKLSYMDFLATSIQGEVARRTQKKLTSALRRANFRNHKTLEEFDFTVNPHINRSLIMDLSSCRFMQEKVCIFNPWALRDRQEPYCAGPGPLRHPRRA